MDITLTLDDELVATARAVAARRGTTLDAMVAEVIRGIGDREAAVQAWVEQTRQNAGHAGPGYRFRREDCYEPWLFE